MKKLLIATKNPGKVNEFQALFSELGIEVQSLLDIQSTIDVKETGDTFEENARLKAEEIAHTYQVMTIADDTGLVVDALGGKPGVYSARYAGIEKNDQTNMQKVLKELTTVPMEKRTARFITVIALAIPNKTTEFVEGSCEGVIALEPKGSNGFGYDPIFYLPEYDQTMAELTSEEKNKISHRAKAMGKLKEKLSQITGDIS